MVSCCGCIQNLWLVIAPSWSECFWMFQGWRIHCGWLNPHLLKVQYPIYIPGRFLDWKANDLFLKNLFFLRGLEKNKQSRGLPGTNDSNSIRVLVGVFLVSTWFPCKGSDSVLWPRLQGIVDLSAAKAPPPPDEPPESWSMAPAAGEDSGHLA